MNELFHALGIESWKSVVGVLLLPPVPLLLLAVAGMRLGLRRRGWGWLVLWVALAGIWMSCTQAAGRALTLWLMQPHRVLPPGQWAELKRLPRPTIAVLGGGRRPLSPEYGFATLSALSSERLAYGLWLGRETSLPVGFSGGVGHGARGSATEAEVAARAAERDFGRRLAWQESQSRDTHENAVRTVALARQAGYETIIVVTHANHIFRAVRNFERAAQGLPIRIVAAPMAVPVPGEGRWIDWLPSSKGFVETRDALHELVGIAAGA